MPPRRSTRGSPSSNRIAELFSGAMDNTGPANPNRLDDRHLLVRPVRPLLLADVSRLVMLTHPIDLMMDLALGRPAMAVVAGATTSLTSLMRIVPTMTSTRRHFSTLSRPPISLCSSNLARILRLRTRPFCSAATGQERTEQACDAGGHSQLRRHR